MDKSTLPDDAEFKGYKESIIQEVKIETDNVKYIREIYYSASQKKTYIAPLPSKGKFGHEVKSLILELKHVGNMSQPKIHRFLDDIGVKISTGSISRILLNNIEIFHKEKDEIFETGLTLTDYHQIDDTSAIVNGKNHHTVVVCNPFYTAYFTVPNKNRLTITAILSSCEINDLSFSFNKETFDLLVYLRVSQKTIAQLHDYAFGKEFDMVGLKELFSEIFPESFSERIKQKIMDASSIAHYHQQKEFPIVEILLSDDAGQYKMIGFYHALCWIHLGRHLLDISKNIGYELQFY